MFYAKNLPGWERAVRLLGAALMATCALHFGRTPLGIVFAASAGVTLLTSLFGFCPACALAGRRLSRSGRDRA